MSVMLPTSKLIGHSFNLCLRRQISNTTVRSSSGKRHHHLISLTTTSTCTSATLRNCTTKGGGESTTASNTQKLHTDLSTTDNIDALSRDGEKTVVVGPQDNNKHVEEGKEEVVRTGSGNVVEDIELPSLPVLTGHMSSAKSSLKEGKDGESRGSGVGESGARSVKSAGSVTTTTTTTTTTTKRNTGSASRGIRRRDTPKINDNRQFERGKSLYYYILYASMKPK